MFPAYLVLWIILNGRITLEIVLVGVAVCLLLTLFTMKLTGQTFKQEMLGFFCVFRYVGYFALLVADMFRSGWRIVMLVLHPKREVRPKMKHVRTGIRQEGHQVLYANSITLTPGTITVELEDGRFWVHALDASLLEGLEDNAMTRKLERLEETKG